MTRRSFHICGAAMVLLASMATVASAAKPWELLIPFKRVEADVNKDYRLTEDHGPWMILAASFVGPQAEQQAQDLVLELRKEFKLKAFVHKKTYDFTEPVVGIGVNRYGGPRKMRYANEKRFDEIAVLAGDFQGVEDPNLEKALGKIRIARPKCLDSRDTESTAQPLFSIRELHRRLSASEEKKQRGPMGHAFVTRNPLLPEEYFAPKGIDPFVVLMNRDVKYSLLDNQGNYTVRIATFRGSTTMNVAEIEKDGKGLPNKLEQAAINAHEMTMALRKQRIEAYEFHDRYESIVTIGSFDTVGTSLGNGRTEMRPEIHAIVQRYGAHRKPIPGNAELGLVPVDVKGIPCDIQPWPVQVPQVSIASNYAPSNRLFQ